MLVQAYLLTGKKITNTLIATHRSDIDMAVSLRKYRLTSVSSIRTDVQ
jgi:hypothetical protein